MTNEIIELNRCSIGVTTGSVYVGVIGHEERHEYSFLGPKVCEQFYFGWLKILHYRDRDEPSKLDSVNHLK